MNLLVAVVVVAASVAVTWAAIVILAFTFCRALEAAATAHANLLDVIAAHDQSRKENPLTPPRP